MKAINTSLVLLVVAVLLSPLVTFAQYTFPDTVEHEYRQSIEFLADRNVVQGFPDGTFGPDKPITRAEMLKIILGATEVEMGTNRSGCFSDVADDRYAPRVCYAKEQKIIQGYGDGSFKPDQPVTIGEGLKMALGSFEADVEEGDGHRWYEPFVDFVHDNSIFSKYALFPQGPMKRGQMAYLVHQLVEEKEGDREFTGRRVSKSIGCEERPPSGTPDSVSVGGMVRHFITSIPEDYDEDRQYKLIVAFHGRTNSNEMIRSYYKIEREAGDEAFVVYPAGLPEEGPTRSRQSPGDKTYALRDFAFFDAIVEKFSEEYCIDEDEIYVVGHSLGAWFTNTLGCARGDVIRGIGSVGGSITKNSCTGPVAAMIMHNPNDNLAGFGGGLIARDHLLLANSCGPTTREYDGPDGSNCVEYVDCQDGAPVIRCAHTQNEDHRDVYYPHVRPTFAARLIWEFWNDQGRSSEIVKL